jgi:hypothetical protein
MPRPIPTPPDGHELLLGRIAIKRPRGSSPYLVIEGHCPGCGQRHRHGWLPEYGVAGIAHRAAHCDDPSSPLKGVGYYIGLDPALDRQHEQILDRFPHRR